MYILQCVCQALLTAPEGEEKEAVALKRRESIRKEKLVKEEKERKKTLEARKKEEIKQAKARVKKKQRLQHRESKKRERHVQSGSLLMSSEGESDGGEGLMTFTNPNLQADDLEENIQLSTVRSISYV